MLHFLLEIGNTQQLETEFYAEFLQTEQTKLPLEQLQYNNDYIICLKFKLKLDIDNKKADEDFKGICKSLWVLLGSFVPMFRLHLKSAFTPQFQVIDGWAYINLRYTNKDDAENLNLINQLINEYLSQNQKDEQVLFSFKSDISVDKFLEELDFSKFAYSVSADGKIYKNTHEILDNLLKISFKDNLVNINGKFIEFVVLYYQLMIKGSFELKFDRLDELSQKVKLKQIKLPIKIPVFKKIKLFSEYLDSQLEFNFYCKYYQFNTGFKQNYQNGQMNIYKIKILDLSRILVGPLATMMLSDLGAEVIKVESMDGDETRQWGPPYLDDLSTYFMSINRNKKSICVDLKKGQHVIKQMASQCDVLVENFSYGVMEKLGLDYENIKKVNPNIVYASVNGFGYAGNQKKEPGFDLIAQAESGLMHITGEKQGQPMKVGVAVIDILTAHYLVQGIQAGLYSGKGALIQTSLYESAIASLVNVSSMYLNGGGKDMHRMGNMHPSISPYGTYKINDDYIVIGVAQDNQFKSLCKVLSIEDDERFIDNKHRISNREQLTQIIEIKLKEWDTQELINKLKEHKVPVGQVKSVGQNLESQQVKDLEIVHQIGKEKMVRSPLKINNEYLLNLNNSPRLNEHRDEICQMFDLDRQQLINDKILI